MMATAVSTVWTAVGGLEQGMLDTTKTMSYAYDARMAAAHVD